MAVRRKLFRTDHSVVVSLPKDVREFLSITEGSQVTIALDKERRRLVIAPTQPDIAAIDEDFARQVSAFIEHYRPVLETLAVSSIND
jgi:bifunctional DNA-binding transcriptional regulator/antitoxin component of YhaV-PrlF toxin-antitoxin module